MPLNTFTPANVFSTNALSEKGSPRGWYCVSTSTGPAPAATFYSMPLIKESTLSKKASQNKKEDEGGNSYLVSTKYEGTFQCTFMQRDDPSFKFIRYCSGNYVAIIKELDQETVGGGYQYAFMPICQGDGNEEYKSPGGELTTTFSLTVAPSQITYDASAASGFTGSAAGSSAVPVSFTVAVNEFYDIVTTT